MAIQWPLILFTLFLCLSGGTLAIEGVLGIQGKGEELRMPSLVASFVFLVIGGIAVFTHLQHWENIFNGFGHITSGITQEFIAIIVIFVAMVITFVMLRKEAETPKWVWVLDVVVGFGLAVVMATSYMMPARPNWDTPLLYLYYLCQTFLLGTLTVLAVAALKKASDSIEPLAKFALIAGIVQALVLVAYAVYIANVGFSDVGYHIDPTDPTKALVDPSAGIAAILSGNLALAFWGGALVLGAVVPAVAGFLGKRNGQAALPIAALVCAVIGGIAWRYILYAVGYSIFVFYL